MTRFAFDHYKTRGEAADAVESLKVVGLPPGNLATAWKEADNRTGVGADPTLDDVPERSPGLGVWLEGIGRLHLTGWLLQQVTPGSSRTEPMDLKALFPQLGLGSTEGNRLCRTLAEGGGIVAIRAPDAERQGPGSA